MINAVTSSKVRYSEREEKIDMCVAIQEIREEGRLEGLLEGEIIGLIRAGKDITPRRKIHAGVLWKNTKKAGKKRMH